MDARPHACSGGRGSALIVVPFVDFGRPYDSVTELTASDWKLSYGGSVRISWNLATIITVDYGRSVPRTRASTSTSTTCFKRCYAVRRGGQAGQRAAPRARRALRGRSRTSARSARDRRHTRVADLTRAALAHSELRALIAAPPAATPTRSARLYCELVDRYRDDAAALAILQARSATRSAASKLAGAAAEHAGGAQRASPQVASTAVGEPSSPVTA